MLHFVLISPTLSINRCVAPSLKLTSERPTSLWWERYTHRLYQSMYGDHFPDSFVKDQVEVKPF